MWNLCFTHEASQCGPYGSERWVRSSVHHPPTPWPPHKRVLTRLLAGVPMTARITLFTLVLLAMSHAATIDQVFGDRVTTPNPHGRHFDDQYYICTRDDPQAPTC